MRLPHFDASARGRGGRGGSRLPRLMAPAVLAMVSGCVVQQTPRVIEGEVALAELQKGRNGPAPGAPGTAPGAPPTAANWPKVPTDQLAKTLLVPPALVAPPPVDGPTTRWPWKSGEKLAQNADAVKLPPVITSPADAPPPGIIKPPTTMLASATRETATATPAPAPATTIAPAPAVANRGWAAPRPRPAVPAAAPATATASAPGAAQGPPALVPAGTSAPALGAARAANTVKDSAVRPTAGTADVPRTNAPKLDSPRPEAPGATSTLKTSSSSSGGQGQTAGRRVPLVSMHNIRLASAAQGAPEAPREPEVTTNQTMDDILNVPVPTPAVIPNQAGDYPIDLATALRLADVANPTIGLARTVILEALANQLAARVLLVPSINGGGNYHGHNGDLQRSSGHILRLSEQSLYLGAGARTLAAETVMFPGVLITSPITDAWFRPLAARQRVAASRYHARATENEILKEVAIYQLELIRNFTFLDVHRLSETQAFSIVKAVGEYAITGQGRAADFDRAKAEWRYMRARVLEAEQGVGVANARLAQRLNLDPSVRLHPAGGPLARLDLVNIDTPSEELIQAAIRQRPDLGERTAEIAEAEAHHRQEIFRPLLPTVWIGFSGGAMMGGSNLTPPLMGNMAGRTDFDVRAYWTLLNVGAGNVALMRQRAAEVGIAVGNQAKLINQVRAEIIASQAEAKTARKQIDINLQSLRAAHAGFHEDLQRSRENLGRPIEVINMLNLLAEARADLVDSIVDYDQAQFRLWVALGSPPPLVETSEPGPERIPEYLVP